MLSIHQIGFASLASISLIVAFQPHRHLQAAVPRSSDANLLTQNQIASTTLLEKQGELGSGDSAITDDKSLFDVYNFEGRAGQTVTITIASTDFDTHLMLFDSQGHLISSADDSGRENTDSRLKVTLPKDGDYRVLVNGYDAQSRGRYSLKVVANQ